LDKLVSSFADEFEKGIRGKPPDCFLKSFENCPNMIFENDEDLKIDYKKRI